MSKIYEKLLQDTLPETYKKQHRQGVWAALSALSGRQISPRRRPVCRSVRKGKPKRLEHRGK